MPMGVPVVSAYYSLVTTRLPPSRTLHTGVAGININFDVKKTVVPMALCSHYFVLVATPFSITDLYQHNRGTCCHPFPDYSA